MPKNMLYQWDAEGAEVTTPCEYCGKHAPVKALSVAYKRIVIRREVVHHIVVNGKAVPMAEEKKIPLRKKIMIGPCCAPIWTNLLLHTKKPVDQIVMPSVKAPGEPGKPTGKAGRVFEF